MYEQAAFTEWLRSRNLSPSTVRSYGYTAEQFFTKYTELNQKNLRDYKIFLIEHYKPQTINLRIRGINCYLEYTRQETWKLPSVRTQQKPFLENVISEADYLYFKNCLRQDNHMYWYFVVRFLTVTGARISELIQIKIEHVETGYLDLYSKGGKLRRIYIPHTLRLEALQWLKETERTSGFLFLNRQGQRITSRGVARQLKHYAGIYGLNTAVVYPHSFRHRFAKSFLERCNDISMLADLMGHESIETTRIYLRKTSTEQQAMINRIVTW
ncbi:MAG: tyrosine-type recombinase/integrase [Eubacteriales bacterium]|nr:tyrosine-type recombinase/integrase [Eubacteriales bacterium]